MSTEVWKFELRPGLQKVSLPDHCRPLSIGFQGNQLMLWAVVVPSNKQVEREFYVCMTGESSQHNHRGAFLGTATYNGFVVHAFDHGPQQTAPMQESEGG